MTRMRMRYGRRRTSLAGSAVLGVLSLLALPASPAGPRSLAQQAEPKPVPLTLREAIDEALAGNPAQRVAASRAAIARADAKTATAPLLPGVEAGAGFTRSVDPVFAFGTRLRQERFTAADFDPDALNRPGAINDWSTEVGVRWAPLDPAAWAGRAAARSRVDAADWEEEWSREQTVFRAKTLYYAAAGMGAALEAARAEEEAAAATWELFRRRAGRGLLTEADVLQAEAELRAAEARRLAVARDAERAREELALLLGWEVDRVPLPVDSLAAPPPPSGDVEPAAPEASAAASRADVRALAAVRAAAASDVRRAGLSFLPRLEAFAGWSGHAADAFDVDGSDWTVGVALRWTLFAGFERVADRQRTEQFREIARIRLEDARRTARAEMLQARRDVLASHGALEATRAAARAAVEARSLLRRRFEEGLATAAELLQAEARAAGARSRAVAALVDYNVAMARLELVRPDGSPYGRRRAAEAEGETP